MMELTVDIGNSRIKWASWQGGEITARGAATYVQVKNQNVFDELFSVLEKPACIYVACVAGEKIAQDLSAWCKQHWQLEAAFLKTEKQFGDVINAYQDPSQHGVDRWAAVVAARLLCPDTSLCIINAGTATAFDFVEKNGHHLGGYILPSYASMQKALLTDTANVASEAGKCLDALFDDERIPSNTHDAVNQGLHRLMAGGVREICQLAKRKTAAPMQVIISGGFAQTIRNYHDMPAMQYDPDLVMRGLYNIMKKTSIK